jgi:hypothetical protein
VSDRTFKKRFTREKEEEKLWKKKKDDEPWPREKVKTTTCVCAQRCWDVISKRDEPDL